MERGLLLRGPLHEGWARDTYVKLYPGGHAAVFGSYTVPLEAEDAGFEVRDCITVVGPQRALVWLLRKPVEEANIAAQVVKTGTGGIFIEGCRVTGIKPEVADRQLPEQVYDPQQGRWPPNLVLVHQDSCLQEGVLQSKRNVKLPFHRGVPSVCVYGDGLGSSTTSRDETIPNWACAPECLVYQLDLQSGTLTSGRVEPHHMRRSLSNGTGGGYSKGFVDVPLMGYGDQGGASRFFPQFSSESELDQWLTRLILGES